MLKFENYILEVKLRAQTPMIHFQSGEAGATLRATEVKPKLDRFIIWKILTEDMDENVYIDDIDNSMIDSLKKSSAYKSIFQSLDDKKDNNALDYKLKIICESAPRRVVINHNVRPDKNASREEKAEFKKDYNGYPIYYGNTGKKGREEQISGVVSNPTINIFCMNRLLQDKIAAWIEEFFIVTNFGTMQNKGFGSFVTTDIQNTQDKKMIGDCLKKYAGADKCYGFTVKVNDIINADDRFDELNKTAFEMIKFFYSVMKTGYNQNGKYTRSYIYVYMHKKGIDNEKAFMKQKGISPIVAKPENEGKHEKAENDNPKYVRALLGTGEKISYIAELNNPRAKQDVSIANVHSSDDEKIERVSSPIYFKIIGDDVYIVARRIPKELYGKEYMFKSSSGSGVLSVPDKFDVDEFLKEYVSAFSKKIASDLDGVREMKKFRKGVVVIA